MASKAKASAAKPTHVAVQAALRRHADPKRAESSRLFFKKSKDDIFLGVTTPQMRKIAKEYRLLPLTDVAKLMHSRVHNERAVAHAILGLQFAKADDCGQKQIFDFFMKHRGTIRDWSGVDDIAPYVVGPYLMERSKAVLYRLIRSRNLWDRRIALVANWPLIRKGQIDDILKLAALVLEDQEDLIHKATGWMLREVGRQDAAALKRFLKAHYARMPRTALRYAIEHFPKAQRAKFLKGQF